MCLRRCMFQQQYDMNLVGKLRIQFQLHTVDSHWM
jgi:hypothetical protein